MDEAKADESFFAGSQYTSSTNKEVANILEDSDAKPKTEVNKSPAVDLDQAAWGEEDDILSIEDDEPVEAADDGAETGHSEIFIPPTPGTNPISTMLRKNPQNAALQACQGEFRKAAELLKS